MGGGFPLPQVDAGGRPLCLVCRLPAAPDPDPGAAVTPRPRPPRSGAGLRNASGFDPGRGRAPLLGPRGSGQHAAWMASGGKVASRHIIADAGATGFNSGIEAGTEVACNQIEVVIDGALSVCSDSHT